jgi:RNA polymerase sigma-70 factor (ECF subfamily)
MSTASPSRPEDPPLADPLERAFLGLRGDVRRFLARRVRPDLVDDLSQEVFLRMHEHAGDLRDADRVAPWLFRIARSVVVDHHRRRRDHAELDAEDEPPVEEPETNFNAEMAQGVRSMMAALPEEDRSALELTEVDGISQRELALRSGLSPSGARSRVQRGRQLLEAVVRACCDYEVDRRGNVVTCSPRPGRDCSTC